MRRLYYCSYGTRKGVGSHKELLKTMRTFLQKHFIRLILFCSAIFCLSGGLLLFLHRAQEPSARVHFFDIGQGDAALIQLPQQYDILIDGGPDKTLMHKLGDALPFFNRTIEVVVLSHPHADHVTGLIEVFKRYNIGSVYFTDIAYKSPVYAYFREQLRVHHIPTYIITQPHEEIVPLEGTQAHISFLYPLTNLQGRTMRDINSSSLVVKVVYGDTEFLFTGDSGMKEEDELLAAQVLSEVSVLKVGHHGSDRSTGEVFLRSIQPEYAVISVGTDNRYGHPHNTVLERLQHFDNTILRTDEQGDVVFRTDGTILTLQE